ncbi:MAG TPA: hypothetical protein PK821_02935 [Victivallales bacterium]|nr:hypothetical protein [Victivallales bacterium]
MFITGLNRFFERHGRKAFATITAIIIVSFVLYFSPGFDVTNIFGPRPHEHDSLPPNVSKEEFQAAINGNLILTSIQMGGAPIKEQFIQQLAYYKAPDWAVSAKIAEERGFKADDRAVFEKIVSFPIFKSRDVFDKLAFDGFLKNNLAPYGLNNIHLEDAVRKEIAQSRMNNAVSNSTVSSDAESDFEYKMLNEKVTAILLLFKNEDFAKLIEPTEDEIRSYFNANRTKYFTDARSKTLVARFNHVNFEKDAESFASEENIKQYYDNNKEKFTNKEGKTEDYDDVRKDIKAEMIKQKISELAANQAQKFALEIYKISMDSKERTIKEIFLEKAKKDEIPVAETDWFDSKSSSIKAVGNEPEFSAAASELIMDQPLSDAIRGNKATFVALLVERQDKRPAELDEVKDEVSKDFKNSKASTLSSQKASETALAITEKLAKGSTPSDIPELKSAEATALPEFSLVKPPTSQHAELISELSILTQPGKLSEIRNTGDASAFIFVEKKNPPDLKNNEDMINYRKQYKQRKGNLAWFNFINSTVDKKNIIKDPQQ